MKKTILTMMVAAFLAACTVVPDASSPPMPTDSPAKTLVPAAGAGLANVLFVRAEQADDGTWTFDVTVSHPDTGWEDYADGWDVVLPDGSVVKTTEEDPFTRLLTHPHVDEQPFTRSQSGIIIPEGITQVTVRAHDLVDGFGGQEVIVSLNQANGFYFEVISPVVAPTSFTTGLTHLQPDGNRYYPARINLTEHNTTRDFTAWCSSLDRGHRGRRHSPLAGSH